jgi:protease I
MADIVMIIASSMFRDEELFETRAELERLGHRVIVASRKTDICIGNRGGQALPDLAIASIRRQEQDALVFVGGGGASEYFDDGSIHRLAREFLEDGKVVGAICIAPVILANAGLLKGRKATVFPSGSDELIRHGAVYTAEPVTIDGRIVTGNGPQSSVQFARALSEVLLA